MPSTSTYTPLESLLFFQSIASLGATAHAFAAISESLSKNDFIRSDESFDTDRLAPKALQELYNSLLVEEAGRQHKVNGVVVDASANNRKRKLSSPPRLSPAEAVKDPKFWSSLIDRLYGEYRAHAVAAIKSDETKYDELKLKLRETETTVSGPVSSAKDAGSGAKEVAEPVSSVVRGGRAPRGSDGEAGRLNGVEAASTAHVEPTRPTEAETASRTASLGISQAVPPSADKATSVAAPRRDVPTPSQTTTPRQNVSTSQMVSDQNGLKPLQAGSLGVQSPSPAGVSSQPPMRPPQPSPIRPAGSPGPPNGSMYPSVHFPQHPQMYQGYPPHQGYPIQPWPQQAHSPQQHPLRASPYAPQQSTQQDFSGRTPIMTRTPQQSYPPYPYHPAQLNGMHPYMHPHGPVTPATPYSYPPHLGSGLSTPVLSRTTSMPRSASLGGRSPWKTTPSTTRTEVPRPPSREVSPIPERMAASIESSGPSVSHKTSSTRKDQKAMRKPERPARRGRAGSASPSITADRSRSESIVSHASDVRNEIRGRKSIKHETPSTPLPLIPTDATESEQRRSSARRPRGNTLQNESQPRHLLKRKRGESLEVDDTPDTPRPPVSGLTRPVVDRDKVYATRNFSRICGPIMNDVTAHKHAGIFAKPLTERDAPGYRSLIYRPSDLKTIKSMIHAGTKAVNAALEEAASASTPAEGGIASPAVNLPTGNTAKNAAILLDKAPELVPPKAIVNSSQLEKELMRMFANAVMFNPMPKSERGFGPNVNLTAGGVVLQEEAEEGEGGVASTEFKGYSNEEDSGNIIRDTREMMANVEEAVRVWRDAEQGSLSFGEEFGSSLHRAESTGMLPSGLDNENAGEDSAMEQDDGEREGEPTGTRKRRRIVEA